MEFFRHCPGCGRRFHIKLESKKKLDEHREAISRTTIADLRIAHAGESGSPVMLPVMVQEGRPIILDIEDFQYTYKCEHCGHEWSEKHVEEHRER